MTVAPSYMSAVSGFITGMMSLWSLACGGGREEGEGGRKGGGGKEEGEGEREEYIRETEEGQTE